MRYARLAVRGAAGLILSTSLAGCLTKTYSGDPSIGVQPRPRARYDPAPELRIPYGAVAAAPEIPLVPLPLPPAERPAPQNAKPASLPVSRTRNDAPAPIAKVEQTAPATTDQAKATPTSGPAPLIGSTPRRLQQQAAAKYATIDSYIVRLTRRETVRGKDKPEETMLFKFRKNPWSLHFRWLEGEGQGREVVFVKDHYDNKLHTLLAAGDIPLTPAGKRMSLPVDSFLVRSASRHAITEAGIGASIERLGVLLDANEKGDKRAGALVDLGPRTRPEFPMPSHGIEHVIPAGSDAELPNGGKRTYWFDPETKLPFLIVAKDDKGKEVEYYFYSRLLTPVNLDDHDFDPDKLWGTPPPATRAGR